jgi:hypothetical protein
MAARRNVTRGIDVEYDKHAVTITRPEREAAGVKAVMVALQRGLKFMGVFRTASWPRLNQQTGFDCPACAWPEQQGDRKFEFCENVAKAVAEEAPRGYSVRRPIRRVSWRAPRRRQPAARRDDAATNGPTGRT